MPSYYTGGQHDSPPPSPVCSDTLSLPDATSDLDMLSDCSGLSVSDEDEKRPRSYTESDTEVHTDDDMEEITHSMLASSELGSPRRLRECRDQSTSTSSMDATDHDRTPSTTYNEFGSRSSGSFHRGVEARDLTYPRLMQDNLNSPFGLSGFSSLYKTYNDESAIFNDQDLQDYSVLDVQGENFRPKYERASQTETDTSTIMDSEATLSHLSEVTLKEGANLPSSALSSPMWLSDPEDHPAKLEIAAPHDQSNNVTDADSLLANWQRCGPRWLNRQTFGIFGVVLLGVAAYHVKTGSWGSVDTNSLFLNTTESLSSQPPTFVAMTAAPRTEHAAVTTHTESKESLEITSVLPLPVTPQPTDRHALSSFPWSVSGLISMASSGIASLSTQVASGSSLSSGGGRSRSEIVDSVIASRKRRSRRKQDHSLKETTTPDKAIQVVPSQVEAPELSGQTATALSTLPKRAQRGLSILAQRSLPCPGCTVTRGTELKEKKKKHASRRTGKHWISKAETASEVISTDDKADVIVNASIEESSRALAKSSKSVNPALFSKLTAHSLWLNMPYKSMHRLKARPAVPTQSDSGNGSDLLLLDNAQALSKLSFGNMCKQLDGLLLPYAQYVVDSLNAINYDNLWYWLHSTMSECYRLVAPYVETIEAQSTKHAQKLNEEARLITSTSITTVNHVYSDVQAYLQAWQATYIPLAKNFVANAHITVKNAKNNVENVSKETVQRIYGQSKSTVKKARHNAQKLLRKQKKQAAVNNKQQKNKKKVNKKV